MWLCRYFDTSPGMSLSAHTKTFPEGISQTFHLDSDILSLRILSLRIDSIQELYLEQLAQPLRGDYVKQSSRSCWIDKQPAYPKVPPSSLSRKSDTRGLNQRRWAYYKQWLLEGKYERAWLLDVRDTVFQVVHMLFMPVLLSASLPLCLSLSLSLSLFLALSLSLSVSERFAHKC